MGTRKTYCEKENEFYVTRSHIPRIKKKNTYTHIKDTNKIHFVIM